MEPLKQLYLSLSEIFNLEDRKGGKQAADALIDASHQIKEPKTFTNPFLDEVESSLNIQGHFLNSLVSKASPNIKWTSSDLREGRIPDDLANQMPMAELVGPDGIFFNDTVRVGLWLQNKDIVYGPRQHAAEETFFIFNGEASWTTELSESTIQGPNTYIYHPSNVLHTSITTYSFVFTAWRWSGDIGFEKYSLHTR